MPRNFYRRIEAVFPVEEPALRDRLIDILETYLKDTKNARILRSNGAYHRISRARKGTKLVSAQDVFAETAATRRKLQEQERKVEPKIAPHTPITRDSGDRSESPEST
ncbi:MAG TPA: hypothetical protein DCX06_13145 [Opitutae bacterium]|nr:hypothetical protein [Opitutae bacterium]